LAVSCLLGVSRLLLAESVLAEMGLAEMVLAANDFSLSSQLCCREIAAYPVWAQAV
jgi:hypothetical protein